MQFLRDRDFVNWLLFPAPSPAQYNGRLPHLVWMPPAPPARHVSCAAADAASTREHHSNDAGARRSSSDNSRTNGEHSHGRCCGPTRGPMTPALFLPAATAEPRGLLIYLHGNGEDLGCIAPWARAVGDCLDVHVLVPEYEGYGIHPVRRANESGCNRAAAAAYHYATEVLGVRHLCIAAPFWGILPLFRQTDQPYIFLCFGHCVVGCI